MTSAPAQDTALEDLHQSRAGAARAAPAGPGSPGGRAEAVPAPCPRPLVSSGALPSQEKPSPPVPGTEQDADG